MHMSIQHGKCCASMYFERDERCCAPLWRHCSSDAMNTIVVLTCVKNASTEPSKKPAILSTVTELHTTAATSVAVNLTPYWHPSHF